MKFYFFSSLFPSKINFLSALSSFLFQLLNLTTFFSCLLSFHLSRNRWYCLFLAKKLIYDNLSRYLSSDIISSRKKLWFNTKILSWIKEEWERALWNENTSVVPLWKKDDNRPKFCADFRFSLWDYQNSWTMNIIWWKYKQRVEEEKWIFLTGHH